MKIGPVWVYTHEGSDADHRSDDLLAFNLRDTGDEDTGYLDVVVFPPGGPAEFKRVQRFPEGDLLPPVGGTYWRSVEDDAPDFINLYRWYNHPEFQALLAQQQSEIATTPAKDHPALREVHLQEQRELYEKLDGEASGEPDQGEDHLENKEEESHA